MASGIAHRLHKCHLRVLITEVAMPLAVRRGVAFAEAVYQGTQIVEGIRARRVFDAQQGREAWKCGEVPLFIDPEAKIRELIKPSIVVDAIMAKKNIGTEMSFAPLVIGVGPGFTAGIDVHAAIETDRGHNLGRVIWSGETAKNTFAPTPVEGFSEKRVLRTPQKGSFKALREIGDLVNVGDILAEVDGCTIRAQIKGVLRGILKDGILVEEGTKAGDIDPRGKEEYCHTISDKARAIAGGVLEAILHSSKEIAINIARNDYPTPEPL